MSSNEGIDKLRAIEQQFDRERASVVDRKSLEDIRTRYLSRKSGLLTLQLQNLGQLPREQRADFGQAANKVKAKIEASLETSGPAISPANPDFSPCNFKTWVNCPGNSVPISARPRTKSKRKSKRHWRHPDPLSLPQIRTSHPATSKPGSTAQGTACRFRPGREQSQSENRSVTGD